MRLSLLIAGLFAAAVLTAGDLDAQRGRAGGGRPSVSRPAPTRSAPRATPRAPVRSTPRAIPQSPVRATPRSAPRPSARSTPTPRSIAPSAPGVTPGRSFGRTPTPSPGVRTPTPRVSTPRAYAPRSSISVPGRSTSPRSVPRGSTPGAGAGIATPGGRPEPRYSTPGITRRSPGITTTPAPAPRYSAPRYQAPRAVGGSVRSRSQTRIDSMSPGKRGSGSKVSLRDLYDRGSARAAPRSGGAPVTSSRVVDRYRTRLQPRTDAAKSAPRMPADRTGDATRPGRSPKASRSGGGVEPGARTASPGGAVRGTASHRYTQPAPRDPGNRIGVRSSDPTVLGGGSRGGSGRGGTLRPGLRRPTAVAPAARGTISALRVSAPRLNPRRSSFGHGFGGGHMFGHHHHHGLLFSLSFGLGFHHLHSGLYGYPYYYGAYWPFHYYRRCFSYGLYGYYRPWCYPYYYRHFSYSWWPSYCYLPSYYYASYYPSYYPSTVVVVGDGYSDSYGGDYGGEEVVVGAKPGESAAALAEKYVNLGDFYFKEGRFQEAADAYARARTYAPNDASIHFVLADALFAVGDYHFAAYLINEAIRLDPDIARADTDKRLFYSDVKVFEKHMQTLLEYLGEKPYDAMAHLVLGYNLKFSGKREEAKPAFQKVLEIEPGNQAARAFLLAIDKPDEPVRLEPEKAESRPSEKGAGEKK